MAEQENHNERAIQAKNLSFRAVLWICIFSIVLALLYRFGPIGKRGNLNILTSATLIETIDIEELSFAEFMYRGIAYVYSDENKTKERCKILYSANVKANIDMKAVKFDFDRRNKTVFASLPEIDIKAYIVDEQTMSIIPANTSIDLGEMLDYCKEDAQNEAVESSELMTSARENLKSTIEGLLYPILKANGYSLEWNQ